MPQKESTTKPKKEDILKGAKLKRPKPYEGRRGPEAEQFLMKMEIYFLDYREAFNDQRKIIATLNNTAKSASAWAQNYLMKIVKGEKHPSLATWETFRQAFLMNFGDTLKREKVITSIGQLTQTKSAQAYTTQFCTLAEELSWAEETLIDIYKKGLKPEVLQHLLLMGMGGQTKNFSLEDWMNYAIQTDKINFASRTRDNKDNTN